MEGGGARLSTFVKNKKKFFLETLFFVLWILFHGFYFIGFVDFGLFKFRNNLLVVYSQIIYIFCLLFVMFCILNYLVSFLILIHLDFYSCI